LIEIFHLGSNSPGRRKFSEQHAEGDERGTNREAVRFFYVAKGSLAELQTQLEIAFAIGYIDEAAFRRLDEKCASLGKMLGSLIKFRSKGKG
jgi:four helix bundle protein